MCSVTFCSSAKKMFENWKLDLGATKPRFFKFFFALCDAHSGGAGICQGIYLEAWGWRPWAYECWASPSPDLHTVMRSDGLSFTKHTFNLVDYLSYQLLCLFSEIPAVLFFVLLFLYGWIVTF